MLEGIELSAYWYTIKYRLCTEKLVSIQIAIQKNEVLRIYFDLSIRSQDVEEVVESKLLLFLGFP